MRELVVALLLFLPTTAFFESYLYVLFLPVALILYWKELKEWVSCQLSDSFSWNRQIPLLLLSVLLLIILINSMRGLQSFSEILQGPLLLLPLTFLAAYCVANQSVLRWILVFTSIEIGIGLLEYAYGTTSFMTSLPKQYDFQNYESFYHTRVFGLGDNSTYLAQKAIFGIVLLYFVDLRLKTGQLLGLFGVMTTGILITFGRTTLVVFAVCIVMYFFALLLNRLFKREVVYHNWNKSLAYASVGLVVFVGATFSFWWRQFTRLDLVPKPLSDDSVLKDLGLGNIEMAGRRDLWTKAIHFIQEHPIWGNESERYMINGVHAHNSFLEFGATHGLIILVLMLLFIALHLNRQNLFFVGAILIYSLGQFGIFWDISFLDIVFYAVLLFSARIANRNYEASISDHK